MITTGGTGGHVFPGSRSRRSSSRAAAACSGSARATAWRRSSSRSTASSSRASSFRGVRGKGLAHAAARSVRAAQRLHRRACAIIRRRAPDVVLGFGGFASFPGALMGVASGKPLVVHDANAVAGLANRILAYGADRVLLGFPDALRGRHREACDWVGNPLRDDIVALPPPDARFAGSRRVRCACSSSAAASARRR